jgi:hypothetical protein
VKPEQAKALRAPFPKEQIGVLPKPTKKDNPKGNCDVCGKWHGLPAVHLDYVGHAAVTDRLLQVDPEWTWEPQAVGPHGEPLVVNGGIWIRLTIGGVTRIGFGDGETPKVMIGDAIRNAAMRFGVALDLWAKEDLHSDGEPRAAAQTSSGRAGTVSKSTGAAADREASSPSVESKTDAAVKAEIELLTRAVIDLSTQLGATDFHATIADHARDNDLIDHLAWLETAKTKAEAALEKRDRFKPPAKAVA